MILIGSRFNIIAHTVIKNQLSEFKSFNDFTINEIKNIKEI